MRKSLALSAAAVAGSLCSFSWVGHASAQAVVNPMWNLPADSATGTDTTAETNATNSLPSSWAGSDLGWYMSPCPNPGGGYTNNGQRCQFDSVEPSGTGAAGGWSFWLQTFCQSGSATQANLTTTDNSVAVTAGKTYTFSSQMAFQDGSGPNQGYNAVTVANQTGTFAGLNSGNLYSYLQLDFVNASNHVIGTYETDIPAGTITTYNQSGLTGSQSNQNGATPWATYSVTGLAPAGTTSAELVIGWANGGLDGGTGGQSAFADDATFTSSVPEPATMSLLAVGSLGLLARRRKQA